MEASWGLGLSVVGGEVTPDRFLVDKIGLAHRRPGPSATSASSTAAATRLGGPGGPAPRALPGRMSEVVALAAFGKRLERIHQAPQDIEFAVDEELPDGGDLILLQCRPETVWSQGTPHRPSTRPPG